MRGWRDCERRSPSCLMEEDIEFGGVVGMSGECGMGLGPVLYSFCCMSLWYCDIAARWKLCRGKEVSDLQTISDQRQFWCNVPSNYFAEAVTGRRSLTSIPQVYHVFMFCLSSSHSVAIGPDSFHIID